MFPENEYDAIVVGSGITGGWAAKELAEKGLQVLLLERGPNLRHGIDCETEQVPPWEFAYRGQGERKLHKEAFRYVALMMDRFNYPGLKGPNWSYGALYLYHAHDQ
jgi:choline dehydrogenase-like flavoprotein